MSLSVLDCNYIYERMLWGIILQGILAQKESYYFSCHLSLLYIYIFCWIKKNIYITKTNDMRNSNFLCFCHLSLLYIWIKMDSLILSINGYGDNRAWWAKDGLASKPFLETKITLWRRVMDLHMNFFILVFFGGNY